jgi:hypothetical protein
MQSPDWTVRRDAFSALAGSGRSELLIQLLVFENEFLDRKEQQLIASGLPALPAEEQLPEDYGFYHYDLIAAVAALKDASTISALAYAGSSALVAREAVVAFGAVAIDPLVQLIESGSSTARIVSLNLLKKILEGLEAGAPERADAGAQIKHAAMAGVLDQSPIARRNAVELLGELPGDDVIKLLEDIAHNDPYRAEYRDGSPYIVRDAAAEVLNSRSNAKP